MSEIFLALSFNYPIQEPQCQSISNDLDHETSFQSVQQSTSVVDSNDFMESQHTSIANDLNPAPYAISEDLTSSGEGDETFNTCQQENENLEASKKENYATKASNQSLHRTSHPILHDARPSEAVVTDKYSRKSI